MFTLLAASLVAHAAVVLALHLGASPLPFVIPLVAVALSAGALVHRLGWRPALAAAAVLGAALLGLVRPTAREPPLDSAITLSGVVIEVEPEPHSRAVLWLAEPLVDQGEHALDRPLRVRFDYLEPRPPPGAVIRFQARLERARQPLNPSTVPRAAPPLYARALTLPEADTREPSWSTTLALAVRARLTFDSPAATALYRALLLGERGDLEPETRYAFQDTGTAHLLAISGMNLALLGWGLFRVLAFVSVRLAHVPGLRRLGPAALAQGHRPRALAAALALACTVAYTELIAPSDATQRALVALAIAFGGILCLRHVSGPRTLALCFLLAAAIAPDALLHAGFQLSFAATAALVLIAPRLVRLRAQLRARALHPLAFHVAYFLAALLLADLACFLATAPLGVAWFGQLPLHGLWVNLVAIPFMTLAVFPAGVIWLLLAATPLGDPLTPALVWLGEAFTDFVRAAGQTSGSASTEAWPLALGVLASLAMLALMMQRRRFARLGAVALAALSLGALAYESPAAGLTLTAFDVGHGDALALRLPDGTRVLVDSGGRRAAGGGDPNRQLAERVLVPALRASGFASLDLLILTHADLDHTGAAQALAERIPIRALWLAPCARAAPAVAMLVAELTRAGTRVHELARAPPFSFGGARVEILGPAPDIATASGCSVSDNDASLVVRLAYAGRSLLLSGDIEAGAEGELVQRYAGALRADVLKVPHHGSRTSSSEAFLAAVDPAVAIVSGLPGRRPPPHPAILERYRRRGIATHVTGVTGAVTVHIEPDGSLEVSASELRPP